MNWLKRLFKKRASGVPKHRNPPPPPPLGRSRMYRGYEYKIWVTEESNDRYYSYRRDGYINLEVHVTYPDGKVSYTNASQNNVGSTINGFIKDAEAYIDRMITEKQVRTEMEETIYRTLSKP